MRKTKEKKILFQIKMSEDPEVQLIYGKTVAKTDKALLMNIREFKEKVWIPRSCFRGTVGIAFPKDSKKRSGKLISKWFYEQLKEKYGSK
tara:strand:- start:552 stop:821 length:270 start_codon:yes stop_codon:yes gene_type:complete